MTTTHDEYQTFIENKRALAPPVGIDIELSDINQQLFPFQQTLVQWALRKGRSAIFADCGLGKTFMQLEWARLTGERSLILAPLAVAQQTAAEAKLLGMDVKYVRSQSDVNGQISITNYEMFQHFDASQFGAVVLDESSILKSENGKTRTALIETFSNTPYRLCCTATPAPNDIAEFANHAEFLGQATRVEMLAMFFVHDDDGWRMKGHAVDDFYRWMASWAMMLRTPSDLGFSDDGYALPPLDVSPVIVEGNAMAVARENGTLFPMGLSGITGRSAARKATLPHKVERAARIVNASDEQWVVWCGLNDEGREFTKSCPDAVLVEGSDSVGDKVERIGRFLDGTARVLVTKTSIAGFGLNLQQCHNQMFIGLSDSYESYYQAIRRSWRFGQENPVNIQIVLSDIETPILDNVIQKEQTAMETVAKMVERVSLHEREELGMVESNRKTYSEDKTVGDGYTLMLGDCVERMKEMPSDSVDLSVFSPPFLSLYVYSDSERDMGNSKTTEEFFTHYRFMLDELHRITKPGRISAVHCSDVAAMLGRDGFIGMKDLPGEIVRETVSKGWIFHGRVTIDKNPQAQALRTKSKGLIFAQMEKDSSWSRPGIADQLLLFRKPGDNATPIKPDVTRQEWILWARPIWYASDYIPGSWSESGDTTRKSGDAAGDMGVRETDTLNVAEGRSDRDERHIAPLQLGTIDRCVRLWSNKGETVFSPFAGIGSEGYQSIKLGREFIGVELKPEYYAVACRNLSRSRTSTMQQEMPLFEQGSS